MNTFVAPLKEYREYQAVRDDLLLKRTPVQVSGCIDTQKSHWIHCVGGDYKYRLIITYNELRAKEICEDYRLFDRNVYYYPAKDIIFYHADVHGNAIVKSRMDILRRLFEGEPCTVVASIDSGIDRLLLPERLKEYALRINAQTTDTLLQLRDKLTVMGYQYRAQVEAPGDFSVRGGILDVFPLSGDAPYRIEYWDEEIDSIRCFDVDSQRSIENVSEVVLYPATEFVLTDAQRQKGIAAIKKERDEVYRKLREEMKTEEAARVSQTVEELLENLEYMPGAVSLDSYITYFVKDTASFFSYFPKEETLFVLDEPGRVQEKAEATALEFSESMMGRLEKGYLLPGQMNAIWDYKKTLAQLLQGRLMTISTLAAASIVAPKTKYDLNVKTVASYNRNFEALVKDLGHYKKQGYRMVLVSGSPTRAARLAQNLQECELPAFFSDDASRVAQPGEIMTVCGNLHKGFEYPLIKFVVISESDIFGAQKKQRKKYRQYDGNKIGSFQELAYGDFIVHETHGLGIYRGIEKLESNHVIKDYIKLEYADGGVLYVLATNLDSLQKYANADAGKKPKLNRLGGTEWKRTKARVRASVKEIAGELVRLYAIRQAKQGHAFGKDTMWQKEFEELFPYTETSDQLKAIEETKRDMESAKIMDRLICGDVGYGKTEIAIRAAFKAVSDGMQVAILVPTTILAQQHYNTFSQRLMDFPVSVEMLSRFRTPTEQKKTLERLRKGQLDIVIGTHRLLSADVAYKNLGLLVVDEEQRFGVTHKEKIKRLKDDVDVLTLTATPIPRTLHMSLVGIRDMSVLEEPPVDRLPIQTFVMEHNEEIIREAICRELARNGQVYYVYNRVIGIDEKAARIAELCPQASVAFAHGQMSERELEKIMFAFINGEIDVLVSTTIIETGMDISNVNTMIIENADQMGLSQLYQLRGRVGRSNRTAYAFLMYRKNKVLKEVAEKRLSAIREFTELGSGFKISMRDLEIRGAGNLLGAEQSGHMEAVGYDLYCKMLNEAVRTLKGEITEGENFETSVELDMDAYIPSSYIKNEMQKLDMYKRIAGIETQEELEEMQDEMADRFGDLPNCANLLLHIALVKSQAHKAYVEKLTCKNGKLELKMYKKARLEVARLPEFLQAFGRRVQMQPGPCPSFTYQISGSQKDRPDSYATIEEIQKVLEKLQALREEETQK